MGDETSSGRMVRAVTLLAPILAAEWFGGSGQQPGGGLSEQPSAYCRLHLQDWLSKAAAQPASTDLSWGCSTSVSAPKRVEIGRSPGTLCKESGASEESVVQYKEAGIRGITAFKAVVEHSNTGSSSGNSRLISGLQYVQLQWVVPFL